MSLSQVGQLQKVNSTLRPPNCHPALFPLPQVSQVSFQLKGAARAVEVAVNRKPQGKISTRPYLGKKSARNSPECCHTYHRTQVGMISVPFQIPNSLSSCSSQLFLCYLNQRRQRRFCALGREGSKWERGEFKDRAWLL